jgi:CCR4-NOT complex subunit CAF16
MAAAAGPQAPQDVTAVSLNSLSFAYPGCAPSVRDVSLDLPRGSRCLLIGANGAGER